MKKKIFVSLLSVAVLNAVMVTYNKPVLASNVHSANTTLTNESKINNDIVVFQDSTIKSGASLALNSILGHFPSDEEFTQENLDKITYLWTPNGGLYPTTLSDFQYMPNIEKIDLRYSIPQTYKLDATPIGNLKNLKSFKFNTEIQEFGGGLSSFIPFANNKNLTEFCYYGEPTTDLSEDVFDSLTSLENLEYTSIKNSDSINIGDLNHLPNLISVKLNAMNATSFPTLEQSKQLTSIIFSSNQLEALPDLSNFSSLRSVTFESNNISNLDKLNTISSDLENLALNKNQITNLPNMDQFNKLQSLGLYTNNLSEIPDLSNLISLNNLNVSNNNINSYKNLDKFNDLNTPPSIDLSRNNLTADPSEQNYKGELDVWYNFIVGFGQIRQIEMRPIDNQDIQLNSTEQLPIIFEWEEGHGTDLYLTEHQKDFIDTKNMIITTNNDHVTVTKSSSNEISYSANSFGSTEITLSYGNNVKTTFTVTVH